MHRFRIVLILLLGISSVGSFVSTSSKLEAGPFLGVSEWSKSFLYVGLANDSQWQVFYYDFANEKSEQLTTSPGDKRRPQYHEATNSIYFKDSQGWIVRLNKEGVETRVSDKGGIAEFCMLPSSPMFFFTRLVANNPQRQALWSLDLDEETLQPQLLKRMDSGSLRQIAIRSDKEIIVSHIAKRREERLYLMDRSGQGSYITPSKDVSIYPSWGHLQDILLYAKELNDGSCDLFKLNLVSGESTPFLQTENASEFATSVSPDGTSVLVEQHVYGMPPRIVMYDISTSNLTPIHLDYPAKEPYWFK